MPLSLLAALLASVLMTSFISGLFGMAGGFILMGLLLMLFTPPIAIALYGVAQLASNFWRAVLWRRYIYFPVLKGYALGAIASVALFTVLQIQLDTKWVYFCLGLLPFISMAMPPSLRLDITRGKMAIIAGFIAISVQLLAGVSGGLLDQFFVHSPLDRRQQMATKAISQVIGHGVKILYFLFLLDQGPDWSLVTLPVASMVILTAVAGNSLAVIPLQRMKNERFVQWSKLILLGLGAIFLVKAALLFLAQYN